VVDGVQLFLSEILSETSAIKQLQKVQYLLVYLFFGVPTIKEAVALLLVISFLPPPFLEEFEIVFNRNLSLSVSVEELQHAQPFRIDLISLFLTVKKLAELLDVLLSLQIIVTVI
jgi:hypothetical protein